MDCIFCKIINGDIPSYTVYEDDIVKCFLDIHPDSNGHTLIIPKNHTLDLDSIDNETLLHIMNVARKLREVYEEKLGIDGIALIQNNGDAQEIKHFHLHLKPFYNREQDLIDVNELYDKIMQ